MFEQVSQLGEKHTTSTEAVEKQTKSVWGQTLQEDLAPELTLHQLPEASSEEVRAICSTMMEDLVIPDLQTGDHALPLISDTNLLQADATDQDLAAQVTLDSQRLPPPTAGRERRLSFSHFDKSDTGRPVQDQAPNPEDDPNLTVAFDQSIEGTYRFRMGEELGRGGMGQVYLADQACLSRKVAIKTMIRESERNPKKLAAFLREALTTGKLAHPNIVPVHLFGRDHQNRLFMVMKRIDGQPWSEVLSGKRRNPKFKPAAAPKKESVRLKPDSEYIGTQLEAYQKVCDAIAFAHDQGVVHRDIKPSNVLIEGDATGDGPAQVMDFGLALDLRVGDDRLTASGAVVGTPQYMSPEQVRCQRDAIGPASDQFSLAALAYELLTGQLPFDGGSLFLIMSRITSEEPEPASRLRPGLDPRVDAVLGRAMAKDPADRHAHGCIRVPPNEGPVQVEAVRAGNAAGRRLAQPCGQDDERFARRRRTAGAERALRLGQRAVGIDGNRPPGAEVRCKDPRRRLRHRQLRWEAARAVHHDRRRDHPVVDAGLPGHLEVDLRRRGEEQRRRRQNGRRLPRPDAFFGERGQ